MQVVITHHHRFWWESKAGPKESSLPETSSPSQMVFEANGVFADNAFQRTGKSRTYYTTIQQQIIGNLENQLNVAFNRGYAIEWFTLTGVIAGSRDTKNRAGLFESAVKLGSTAFSDQNLPNTNINLSLGMQVLSYASSQPLKISAISKSNDTNFTVTFGKEDSSTKPPVPYLL